MSQVRETTGHLGPRWAVPPARHLRQLRQQFAMWWQMLLKEEPPELGLWSQKGLKFASAVGPPASPLTSGISSLRRGILPSS